MNDNPRPAEEDNDPIVAVDAEMVIPLSDPSEPCLEPETVALLRDIHQHAEAGDIAWLQSRGKVYQLVDG